MDVDSATVVSEETAQAHVNALQETARNHKREAERHRRKAKSVMKELDRTIAYCKSVGIAVEVAIPRTTPLPKSINDTGSGEHDRARPRA